MELIESLIYALLHLDDLLFSLVSTYGVWTYVALFFVIFCETGLVIFPFLPGDSLLFAAGSISANSNSTLSFQLLFVLLTLASILGNKVNYLFGRALGPKVFKAQDSWLLNKKHLEQAHLFYTTHGGKTIIFARFLPILRTFAPFVAGVGYMDLKHFSFFNILSAFIWIGSLLGLGFFFGQLPIIRDNFTLVIYGIIGFTLIPPIFAFIFRKKSA